MARRSNVYIFFCVDHGEIGSYYPACSVEWVLKADCFGNGRPPLLLLFFTDDLVLFGEATNENEMVIHKIFDVFCYYFGYKVNSSKLKFFFSRNTDISIQHEVGNVFGFSQTEDLGYYLGMPLFHSRVKKMYSPIHN